MSIIVDALERVQADRQAEELRNHDHKFAILEDPASDDGAAQSFFNKKFIIAFLVVVLGTNAYLMYEDQTNEENPFIGSSTELKSIPQVKTVDEIEPQKSTNTLDLATKESDEVDEEFLAAFDEEDNSTKIPEKVNEPIELAKPIANEITEPAPAPATIAVNETAITPEWIINGKQAFENNKFNAAISLWQKGFSQLDTKTQIFSIMINRVPKLVSKTLTNLYANHIDAFTVKGLFKGKPAYFTITLYPKENALGLMANIEQSANAKPFKTTKNFVQKHINQLNSYTAESKPTPAKQNPIKLAKKPQYKRISKAKRLQIAEDSVINGNYKKAIQKLRPILFSTEANWEVLFWMGSAKLGLGLYNEADHYFNKALELNSDMPQVWTQRAIIAQEKNDHIAALKFLHRAQKLAPNAPEIILNIAYSNDSIGDKNGAVFAYREYLTLTKGNSLFAQQRQAVLVRLEELGY